MHKIFNKYMYDKRLDTKKNKRGLYNYEDKVY
jgi:hypothetical protein